MREIVCFHLIMEEVISNSAGNAADGGAVARILEVSHAGECGAIRIYPSLLRRLISMPTETVIWLSTQGDSNRMTTTMAQNGADVDGTSQLQ